MIHITLVPIGVWTLSEYLWHITVWKNVQLGISRLTLLN